MVGLTVRPRSDAVQIAELLDKPGDRPACDRVGSHSLDGSARLPHSHDGRHGPRQERLHPADGDAYRRPGR
jgi:hypothetical protein